MSTLLASMEGVRQTPVCTATTCRVLSMTRRAGEAAVRPTQPSPPYVHLSHRPWHHPDMEMEPLRFWRQEEMESESMKIKNQNWCTVTMTQTSELQKIRSRIIVYSEVGVRAQMRSPDDQQGMMGRLSADFVAHLSERQTVLELSFLFSLFLRWDFSRERLDLFILFLHFSAQQVVLLSVRVRKWPFHLWV